MITGNNELGASQNPYLLQHKDNPVAWKEWGTKAFEEARLRNVPVLVSIGYSTCHWCHVMAHEVFEDTETARMMNAHLVCIKVDREAHPEVDEVYMQACQVMNGNGGWPLNIFTGHDGKPFLAATYVPRDRWKSLVMQISQAWAQNHAEVLNFASRLSASLQESVMSQPSLGKDLHSALFAYLTEHYDTEHPDFSGKGFHPRFPSHTLYYFLLSQRKVPIEISAMLEAVLETIQDSGLHDRVGGGFHRYSTDREWRVPHFEKMLYDNAQLMASFAMASSRFNRPDFLTTAQNIASYLMRDMMVFKDNQFLGFATAEDADNPMGEGSFYAWTSGQLIEVLGEEAGSQLADDWNLLPDGAAVHGVYRNSIPHPRQSPGFMRLSFDEKMKRRAGWESYHGQLLEKRNARPRPFRDDKVITECNALALLGFSVLYVHHPKKEYHHLITDLAKILLDRFTNGVIQRLPGKAGHITDFGHTALALFTAWEATGDDLYLKTSEDMVQSAFEKFAIPEGRIFTCTTDEAVFMRYEEKYDHAQPAGAHSLLLAWTRLHTLGRLRESEPLVKTILDDKRQLAEHIPAMAGSLLQVFDEYEQGPVTLSFPFRFRSMNQTLMKWAGTQVRLIPDFTHDSFQLCEKDRCLLPVTNSGELPLTFEWNHHRQSNFTR